MANDRVFAANVCPSMDKGGLLQVEAMQLCGIPVHLGVVLLDKGLPYQSWGWREERGGRKMGRDGREGKEEREKREVRR